MIWSPSAQIARLHSLLFILEVTVTVTCIVFVFNQNTRINGVSYCTYRSCNATNSGDLQRVLREGPMTLTFSLSLRSNFLFSSLSTAGCNKFRHAGWGLLLVIRHTYVKNGTLMSRAAIVKTSINIHSSIFLICFIPNQCRRRLGQVTSRSQDKHSHSHNILSA